MNRNIAFALSFFILTSCFPLFSKAQSFHVEGRKLLDPNDSLFIIRGVNNAHAWHYTKALKSLEYFKELKMNSVRVVWESGLSGGKLKEVVEKSIENKLIPIIELHDATGDTTAERLMEMVSYYTSEKIKKVLLPFDDKIIINIANEWGTYETTAEYWKESYLKGIEEIRNAGYKAPIVIDGTSWGQNHEPILQYGRDLLEADPLQNIIFSIHMYSLWNDPKKIDIEFDKLYDTELCIIVGEFGYNFDKGFNNLKCKLDHVEVMRNCHEHNFGYLAWSWSGNNKVNAWLDLSEKRDWQTLTWWGRQVVNSEFGIAKNAKLASIFPDETEEEKVERLKKEEKAAKKAARIKKRTDKLTAQNKKRRELAKERSKKLKEKADIQKEKQQKRLQERREKKETRKEPAEKVEE